MIKKVFTGLCFLICTLQIFAAEPPQDYIFFTNSRMTGNYFFSKVSYTNGSYVTNIKKKLLVDEEQFHTPGNSLHLTCTNAKDGTWQASVFMNAIRGVDQFKPVKDLSFWIYTKHALSLPGIKLMKSDSTFTAVYQPDAVIDTGKWNRIVVSLKSFSEDGNKPENFIAVSFLQSVTDNSKSDFNIDDIEFISDTSLHASALTPSIDSVNGSYKHVDIFFRNLSSDEIKFIKVYRSADGENFQPVGVQSPQMPMFTDFTGVTNKKYWYRISALDKNYNESALSASVTAQTHDMTNDELLSMVQQACFRYYWQGAEKASGLALECIPGRQNMIATGASGFGLMALIVVMDRQFISRKAGVQRLQKIISFLAKADNFHGAIPHFIDGPSGKTEPFFGTKDNGADLVETSFFVQGLLAVRAYLNPAVAEEKNIIHAITKFWEKIEWRWYRQTADSKYLYWHWSPDQAWVIHHPLIGFNETMITYLLAISSPTFGVPASMYYSGFASQDTMAQEYRGWGNSAYGRMYSNGESFNGITLPVGVSNGGPLFFTHYSYMAWDPKSITDKYTNYFDNNKAIATINYRYSLQNPNNESAIGSEGWGFTASDGPTNYFADEPIQQREDGKITPTGAIASMPYLPQESMAALKKYYNDYGKFLWGEYGFRDACNIDKNWCSDIFMGLNQAPMVVMIENYRTGLIWKLFMSNKDVQTGLQKLNAETKLQQTLK